MTECDHAGPGQCGDIDHHRGLEALGVGQCVTQDQAAFGIGVENLDGLARHAGDHVARLHGVAGGHVLARRNDADQVELGLEFGDRTQRAEHARSAAHVVFHLVHLGACLQRDTAGVEGDALADQHHRRLRLGRAVVARHDEAQRLGRGLRDRQKRPHAEFLAGLAVEHLDLEAVLFAEFFGYVGQMGRRAVVAGPVGPLACQGHARADGGAARQADLHWFGVGLGAQQAQLLELGCRRRTRLRVAIQISAVAGGGHDRLGVRICQRRAATEADRHMPGAAGFDQVDTAGHRSLDRFRAPATRNREHHAGGSNTGGPVQANALA